VNLPRWAGILTRNRPLAVFAAGVLAACAVDPISPDREALHLVGWDTASVGVMNRNQRPVYYRAVPRHSSAPLVPCTSPADCPEIPPREMVRIRYSDAGLSRPENTEGVVHWWVFESVDGGYAVRGEGRLHFRMH
jgi:hypothetical protein